MWWAPRGRAAGCRFAASRGVPRLAALVVAVALGGGAPTQAEPAPAGDAVRLLYRRPTSGVTFAAVGDASAAVEALDGLPEPSTSVGSLRLEMPSPLRQSWMVPVPSQVRGVPRFADLERLYFVRLAGGERRPGAPRELAELLPLERAARGDGALAGGGAAAATSGDPDDEIFDPPQLGVQDFPLPSTGGLILRQVVDFSHPRIAEQYWALYAGDLLVDLWHFSPLSSREDGGKVVTPLLVETVRTVAGGRLELRTCGSMVRPQGAWWAHQRDLTFVVEADAIRLASVVAGFFAGQGYDLGVEAPIGVSTETIDGDRIVRRTLDPASPETLRRCGFTSELDCDAMLLASRCVTADVAAEIATRGIDEPSFVERGGSR